MAAGVNKIQFLSLLKSLNLDLSGFSDLSFDGICEEPSLKIFIYWLCSSFDNNNVLTDDEAETLSQLTDEPLKTGAECLDDFQLEMYSSILTSLERRYERTVYAFLEKRRCVAGLQSQCADKSLEVKHQTQMLSNLLQCNNCFDLIKEMNETAESCLNKRLCLPDLKEYSKTGNLKFQAAKKHSIESFVMFRECCSKKRVEETDLKSYEDSQIAEDLSVAMLKKTLVWVKTKPTMDGWEEIQQMDKNRETMGEENPLVAGAVAKTKKRCIEKDIDDHLTAIATIHCISPALSCVVEIMSDDYFATLVAYTILEAKITAAQLHEQTIRLFYKRLTSEIDAFPNIYKPFLSPKQNSNISPIWLDNFYDSSKIFLCSLLDMLKAECERNSSFRADLSTLLTSLRTGPSLRFTFIPIKLQNSMVNCQSLRNRLSNGLRQLAVSLTEQKKRNANVPERSQKLLWVAFLAGGLNETRPQN